MQVCCLAVQNKQKLNPKIALRYVGISHTKRLFFTRSLWCLEAQFRLFLSLCVIPRRDNVNVAWWLFAGRRGALVTLAWRRLFRHRYAQVWFIVTGFGRRWVDEKLLRYFEVYRLFASAAAADHVSDALAQTARRQAVGASTQHAYVSGRQQIEHTQ